MKVAWKLKSKIFAVIDFFNAPRILYFLQKYVTKRSRISSLDIKDSWRRHKDVLSRYNSTGLVFEFGAGKNLAQNLYISDLVSSQLVVDLNPMLDVQLVETARKLLADKIKLKSDSPTHSAADLVQYGITYKAPYDASKTDLADETLDACISTNTLEHIPRQAIVEIFNELHRVLKQDGIVSAKIDYSDHYAHTDPSISLLNYLSFSDGDWEKHNHRYHFQNRMRHYEYVAIFDACGFKVAEETLDYAEKEIPEHIARLYDDEPQSWSATSAHVVLLKK